MVNQIMHMGLFDYIANSFTVALTFFNKNWSAARTLLALAMCHLYKYINRPCIYGDICMYSVGVGDPAKLQ